MAYDSSHPEVIRAEGEARARKLEARAKLHPFSQAIVTFFDSLGDFIANMGCLFVLIVIALSFFAPTLFTSLMSLLNR